MELKIYQGKALGALQKFLFLSRLKPVAQAFTEVIREEKRADAYQPIFGEVPCVCLRVPTGGGKTIMAAHSIAIAGKEILDSSAPVVVWLTPSDAICSQTREALSNKKHPYNLAMQVHFKDRFKVCELSSLQTITPHDFGRDAIVIVATFQAFNVTETTQRNVYSFFEELQPHFDGLTEQQKSRLEKVTESDIQVQRFLTKKDIGRVKTSVANLLNLRNPIVIIDEAHNSRTDRFFKTLDRLNPSCVIEWTATPVPGNNVLYHVSAAELRAEQMIKLPIVLSEHPTGWEDALHDAILAQKRLETLAINETEYIRPIVLVQAEPKGGRSTWEVVKKHLIDNENIPEEQIAVATGTQKELDGVDLFDRTCKVRYVITIEALKEGWDCSFAYVLSSLQSVNSAKDVEQLLGRVLRMPYAKDRQQAELNRAYAHIVADNFAQAASTLRDKMVQNMGFEKLETAGLIVPQGDMFGGGGKQVQPGSQPRPEAPIPDCFIELSSTPDTSAWPEKVKEAVRIVETSQGATALIKGDVSHDDLEQVEVFLTQSVKKAKDKDVIKEQIDSHRAVRRAMRAPAQLGIQFAAIPQLCLDIDGHLEIVEKQTLTSIGDWDLLSKLPQLEGFSIHETSNSFVIDLKEGQVNYKFQSYDQLNLNDVESNITEQDLVRWLDAEVRQPDIGQSQLRAYLTRMVTHLVKDRGFSLSSLVRARYQLAKSIVDELKRLRGLAIAAGFQSHLFEMRVPTVEELAHYSFHFQPGQYPARNIYRGRFEFSKHFYEVIHDLSEKTPKGMIAEEFRCAQALDSHPKVVRWVRNIEGQEKFSFWYPTSTDYFYPDFVAELDDGRVLVVEYKGEVYATNDDSREKSQIGHHWEKSSNGRCLFLFALKVDALGRDVFKQIAHKLS